MTGIDDFFASIRDTGGYTTPAAILPAKPPRASFLSAWRFYVGGLGKVISEGMHILRAGDFGTETLGQLSWSLLHSVENMGASVTFEGFESMRNLGHQPVPPGQQLQNLVVDGVDRRPQNRQRSRQRRAGGRGIAHGSIRVVADQDRHTRGRPSPEP